MTTTKPRKPPPRKTSPNSSAPSLMAWKMSRRKTSRSSTPSICRRFRARHRGIGTSNRQTKALAASVRDKVKGCRFHQAPHRGRRQRRMDHRDCGAVAHIMQPTIRQYYRLKSCGRHPWCASSSVRQPAAPVPPRCPPRRPPAAQPKPLPSRMPCPHSLAQVAANAKASRQNGCTNRRSPQERDQACQQACWPRHRKQACEQDPAKTPASKTAAAASASHQAPGRQDPHENRGGQAARPLPRKVCGQGPPRRRVPPEAAAKAPARKSPCPTRPDLGPHAWLLIVAVGQRVPDWAQTAYDDYAKGFRRAQGRAKAVKTEPRGSKTLKPCMPPSASASRPPFPGHPRGGAGRVAPA